MIIDIALQKKLKEKFNYNPETGVFTYLNDANKNIKKGNKAGYSMGKRRYIVFDGASTQAGLLVILYMDGYLPAFTGFVDEDVTNLRYDNVFASDIKRVYNLNRKKPKKIISDHDINPKAKTSIERMRLVLSCLDGGKCSINWIIDKLGFERDSVIRLLDKLIAGGQVEMGVSDDCVVFRLTVRGHCRIFTAKDESDNKRLTLHVQLYRIFNKTMKDIERVCRVTDRLDYVY